MPYFVLIGTLVNLPGVGAAEKPLGMVTQSQAARVDRADAAVGATVYAGDTIDTDSTGSIRLRAGQAQYYLMSSSSFPLAGVSRRNSRGIGARHRWICLRNIGYRRAECPRSDGAFAFR